MPDTFATPSAADDRRVAVVLVGPAALRQRVARWLDADARCRRAGAFDDAAAALDWLAQGEPAVVLLLAPAQGRQGLEGARLVMERQPRPLVLAGELPAGDAASWHEGPWHERAIEAGALAGVMLPPAGAAPDDAGVRRLLDLLLLMSEVRVVRRWARGRDPAAREAAAREAARARDAAAQGRRVRPRVVGIGASTGGPPVLHAIFAGLPADFPLPILVVQHIAPGFLPGLIDWLQKGTPLRLDVAQHGTLPQAGHVYLAPDGAQMSLDAQGRIEIGAPSAAPGGGPSVASLFRSLAEVCGPAAIGVLLTGMGKDGAAELGTMKARGAVTIAQDVASSAVHGMPGEAIALGGATHVLGAEQIAAALVTLARQAVPQPETSA